MKRRDGRPRDDRGRPGAGHLRPRATLAAAILVAMALGALAYASSLDNPFVYDDRLTVVENEAIRHLDNPLALLLRDVFRPVVNLSYAIDHSLWGEQPFGFHLTSLLLHLTNVALLLVLGRLAWGDWCHAHGGAAPDDRSAIVAGFVAASLLAVHPLMTEPVGYASARSELLAGLFMAASLLALRRFMVGWESRWLAAGIAAFALALGAKEIAAVLPILVFLYDRLLLPGGATERHKRLWRVHVPFLTFVLLAAATRLVVFAGIEQGPAEGFGRNLPLVLVVGWRYLFLLLYPVHLSLVHDVRPLTSLVGPAFALAGGLAAAVVLFRARRRWPLITYGAAWFVLVLAPSHVIPLAEAMSEHRAYAASWGIFLAAGAAGASLQVRLAPWLRALALGILAVLLAALSLATRARLEVWSDPIRLWQDAADKAPSTWAAQYALGDALRQAGRCGEALRPYRRAIDLIPAELEAHLNLGICLAETGQLAEARRAFLTARELAPTSPKPANNLGLLALLGRAPEEARRWLEEALRLDPRNVRARQLLVQLHEQFLGDPARALALCREIKALAPATPGVDECLTRNQAALAK
ncbi:MAG: tetratricopeptide repeat protein [Acidobacteriota bacterium]